MRHKVNQQLYAYWSRLKGARSAPERSEIDPAEIREALPDSFIIEIDEAGRFPIRLCGTRLNALWLDEQKGKSFLDLWSADDRRTLASVMLTVIDGVAPVVAGVEGRAGEEGDMLELELLLLPLRHFGKTHSRVLGALAPARRPRWLGVAPANPLRLKSFRVIAPSEARYRLPEPTGRRVVRPAAAGRPELVLYRGGKA
ncbi:PAS domain-containing protein [Methylosinus sp. H3A]|uniref:PAS domain-containing protein n=1 Tax=Methylosinus sp. H3A TaxID=2785786 RepID=UPI0018C2FBDE|nr:PAS domain-containing protein [Methylosinus sp. H3A]MBG0808576.1 PAS domain-containing protein [Methylosinus sp. H3A]